MVRLRARCPQFPDLPAYCRSAGLVKHPKVQRWLERHPRFHMPFTRTSTSWLSGAFLPGSHPQSIAPGRVSFKGCRPGDFESL